MKGDPYMHKHLDILRQVARLAAAIAVFTGGMLAVYVLLGALDREVVVGALLGWALAVGNFFALCVTVSNAVDRAVRENNPQGAQLTIQSSSTIRLLVLVGVYILLFRAGVCDPLATLLPILFAQTALKLVEFFRKEEKDGDPPL